MMTGMNADRDLDLCNTNLHKTVVIDSKLSRRQVYIAALQETLVPELALSKRNTTPSTGLGLA